MCPPVAKASIGTGAGELQQIRVEQADMSLLVEHLRSCQRRARGRKPTARSSSPSCSAVNVGSRSRLRRRSAGRMPSAARSKARVRTAPAVVSPSGADRKDSAGARRVERFLDQEGASSGHQRLAYRFGQALCSRRWFHAPRGADKKRVRRSRRAATRARG